MKISQVSVFTPESLFENEKLAPNEYYIWTVTTTDGETIPLKIRSLDNADRDVMVLCKLEGKVPQDVQKDMTVHTDEPKPQQVDAPGMDDQSRREYHRQQDSRERGIAGKDAKMWEGVDREVYEKYLAELSVNSLGAYRDATAMPRPTDRLGKVVKHARGHTQAINKIAKQTGDKTPNKDYARTVEGMAPPALVRAAYDRLISFGVPHGEAITRAPQMALNDMQRPTGKKAEMKYPVGKVNQGFTPGHKSSVEEDGNDPISNGPAYYIIVDKKTQQPVGKPYSPAQKSRAKARADKLDNEYGAYRYSVKPIYNNSEELTELADSGEYAHDFQGWQNDASSRGLTVTKAPQDESGNLTNNLVATDAQGNKVGHFDGRTGSGIIGKDANDYQQRISGGFTNHVNDQYSKEVSQSGMFEDEQLTELSNELLGKYKKAAGADASKSDASGNTERGNKRFSGIVKATNKQFGNDKKGAVQEALLDILGEDFTSILGQQHKDAEAAKPKPKTVDIQYHGWTIRYRPASKPGEPVVWQVQDKKGEVKHKAEASTDKDAVQDAESWINKGGDAKQAATSNVTIDFNVDFAKEFAPEGDVFYAAIDSDNGTPMLIISTEPQQGFKKSHVRTQPHKQTAGTTRLPAITMTAKEANAVGLQANGRYMLGSKDPIDDHTAMFPLIFQSIVQGKGDMMKMGKPGLTVAHNRD